MFRNYFLVAVRNLLKNKTFSSINIMGLALGMACSLLIFLWVKDERSIDAFHANGPRIYKFYERQFYDGKTEGGYYTPGLLPAELKKVLPEVVYASGLTWSSWSTLSVGEKMFKQPGAFASPDFFNIFSYKLLEGKAEDALNSPVSIAISRKVAEKLFESPAAAIGKTVRYENRKDFKVTAVFEDLPSNSSQSFQFLLNWDYCFEENEWLKDWGNNGPETFVLLKEGANPIQFENKIRKFLDAYNKEQNASFRIEMGIQRFDEAYLNSNFKDGQISGGRIEYVKLFSIVAIFILLIACINFMNLTTARSVKRAKEIGIRKVVGAVKGLLIRQFIGEAVLLSIIAIVLSLLLVSLLLPAFNNLTTKSMALPLSDPAFWMIIVGLALITGVISGSYPALVLSSFQPIKVLKGSFKFNTGSLWFRKGLVVFQFTLSVILIIGTIVVSNQVNYFQTKNLGYNRENLITIPLEGDLLKKYSLFKERAVKLPGVLQITRITQQPTQIENLTGGVEWPGKDPTVQPMFTQAGVGYDFTKTMKAQMLLGRDFSKDFPTDSVGYIVNESALKKIGYKDPIGKPLTFWRKKGVIVGVIKDFHFNSLRVPIQPLVVRLMENQGWGSALVRIEKGKTEQVLAGLEKLCKEVNPAFPFSHQFADEEYQLLYTNEKVISQLSRYFAFLAIFISCLGLLGLAIFTAEQRTKEISIRKVLGASVGSVFSLLSKEFIILVGVSLIIASPIAWWFMNNWLQDYAYRAPISWWIFALAAVLAILIALLTVSFQAIKAAVANPIKSLRSE